VFFMTAQNNAGGVFDDNPEVGISMFIFVEAPDAKAARRRFRDILEDYRYNEAPSCACCGSRWSVDMDDSDAMVDPQVHGIPVREYGSIVFKSNGVFAYVHYLDGRIEPICRAA
jgi:hypothetical protein